MARTRTITRPGFTLVEAMALTVALGVGVATFGLVGQPPATTPAPTPPGADEPAPSVPSAGAPKPASGALIRALANARASARQLKCATQVRGICQSFIVWASSNGGEYPLPSRIDATNQTVPEIGRAKETSANIYSLLIFNGFISSELCVCPDEHQRRISADEKYGYSSPAQAVNPVNALWDPGFRADFIAGRGNVSYAHLQPSGDFVDSGKKGAGGKPVLDPAGRLKMWRDTFMTSEPIVGDRGPEIASAAAARADEPESITVKTKLDDSVTFRNHGPRHSWEGNRAYNDNHVDYVTTLGPDAPASRHHYHDKNAKLRPDCAFFDEPDDPSAENSFLGLFVKAGVKPSDFKAIWD